MQFSTFALAALASLASAQNTGTKMHVVTVGINGTLKFSPESVTAAVGDMIQFQFVAGNHTATQSTFDAPCQPISAHSNLTGFHSGFQPAAASQAMGMTSTYTVPITDTKPIWVYCAQGKHCESGMVMVVNEAAGSNKTLAAYKQLAASASTTVPSGTNTTTGGTSGTTTTTGTGSAAATGGASGIATSGAVGLLAVVAALFML